GSVSYMPELRDCCPSQTIEFDGEAKSVMEDVTDAFWMHIRRHGHSDNRKHPALNNQENDFVNFIISLLSDPTRVHYKTDPFILLGNSFLDFLSISTYSTLWKKLVNAKVHAEGKFYPPLQYSFN